MLQFWKYLTHQCTKMSQRESSCFLKKKLQKSNEFDYLEPGLYPSVTDFFEAMNNLFQEKHYNSESCITVIVCRRTQKVEFYHANAGSALAIVSTDLGHISVATLAMNLDWCWNEKDITNQNSRTTLSGYTLSWYTETCRISSATWRHYCCVAFFSFQSSKLETF